MKNYIKSLGWRKAVSSLIICSTLMVGNILFLSFILTLVAIVIKLFYELYVGSPTVFFCLVGSLFVAFGWLYLWDWAKKQ